MSFFFFFICNFKSLLHFHSMIKFSQYISFDKNVCVVCFEILKFFAFFFCFFFYSLHLHFFRQFFLYVAGTCLSFVFISSHKFLFPVLFRLSSSLHRDVRNNKEVTLNVMKKKILFSYFLEIKEEKHLKFKV